jgi:predicted Fe-S protein YdhL (DUF1289 family)
MSLEAVPSPCTLVCALDPVTAICIGCGRTADEIGEWTTAPPERQRRIVTDAAARLADAGLTGR